MIDNRFLAGLIAGIPVSLLCLACVAVRRDAVVRQFTEAGGSDALAPGNMTVLAFVVAAAIGPVLGIVAAFVHGWLPSEPAYLALAAGLATLFSFIAVVARTPMMIEKIVLNYAVVVAFAIVAPRLAGG